MPTVNFQAPTDYAADQADIDRRRKYAEILQAQALAPDGGTETVGGWAIKKSPMEGLGKVFKAYLSKGELDDATARQKALASEISARRSQELAQALRLGQGTPAQTIQPDPQEAQQSADQGTPAVGPVQQAAVPPNRQAMIAALAGSQFPDFQQQALTQAMAESKPTVLGRTLVRSDGSVIATDATWEKEQQAAREEKSAQEAAKRVEKDEQQKRDLAAKAERDMQRAEDKADLARTVAGLRAPPQAQPLVQIMGPDNTPIWVERKDAVGKVPAGAGSKAEMQAAGKSDVDKDVVKLKDTLDRLRAGGGIVDTKKGGGSNLNAAIGSSGVGQAIGGALGTKNQSARNELLMIRPSLLRSIMSSTGMSAKQMDSNAELKLWLSTATDPTKDYQANIAALDNIARKYGSGGFLDAPADAPKGAAAPGGVQEGATATGPKGERIVFRNGKWVPQ